MKKIYILLLLITSACFTSCENEPAQFTQGNLDFVDEELFDFLKAITSTTSEETLRCVRFNYSFTIFTYNENMELRSADAVFNNADFIALLENVDPGHSISVNYPIAGTLSDGSVVAINNNEELKTALKSCVQEERRRRCNNTLIDCNWSVTPIEDAPNDFEGAVYKIDRDGTVQFHYKNSVYFGTWITLYIGDDLYLNIDLNDDVEVEEFWDHNWNVALFTQQQITLNNDEHQVSISKDCSIPCTAENYQVCEMEDTPGFAEFNLEKYTPCLRVPFDHDVVSALSYTFFETEEEAIANINAINTTAYTNLENPQTLFARTAYKNTDEGLEINTLTIEAVSCPG